MIKYFFISIKSFQVSSIIVLRRVSVKDDVHKLLIQNDKLKVLLKSKSVEATYKEMDIDHDNHITISEMVKFAMIVKERRKGCRIM